MIIYEVNLAIAAEISMQFRAWLTPHIQDMLALPGFQQAECLQVESEELNTDHLCVRYHLRSRAALENYFTDYAPAMRAQGLALFGNKFSATRRILSTLPC